MNKLVWSCLCLAPMVFATVEQCDAQQKKPCEHARFADDAGSVYNIVTESAAKETVDVVVYCEEEHYVLDGEGREARTSYLLYKVLTQRGAEGWDGIEKEWEPWHEVKPELRARVLSEGKPAQWLDQKTISDGAASESEDKIYSDRRVVRAPLPAITPGVVVEQEIVQRDTAPFFAAGIAKQTVLVRSAPVREARVIVEAPSAIQLKYVIKLLPKIQVKKTESNQTTRLEFDQDLLEEYDDAEELRPPDVPAYPTVAFATGKSWREIARAYSAIVDKQGNVGEVKALTANLTKGKTSREEKIEALVQYLSHDIRYTGIEFDEAAIVPHTPGETLKRKYGDCKDKATLLVAMLRAAEIPANVALLNVAGWADSDEELPGLGLFDHAIVEVPGSPEYWIDATEEFARLGQLPASDQGRLALIAAENTEKLKRIPETSSEENRMVEKREIRLAEHGPANVTEITEPHGVFEPEYRSWYVDEINKDARKKLADYVKSQYLAERLGKVQRADAKDFSKDFTLTLEAEKARRGYTELDSAVAAIRLDGLFRNLPETLREKDEEPQKKDDGSEAKPKKERVTDYQLHEAFVSEWDYTIVPPDGFQMKAMPESKRVELGPALLEMKFQARADGAVEAKLRFDTVKRRFTAKEGKEMRNRVAELSNAEALLVRFEPMAAALMNQGKAKESFATWRAMIGKHPTEAVRHLQYAKALLAAGLGGAARAEAKTAVKLDPNSALAEKTLAEILEFDLVGRKFKVGSDYAGAEAAFRAAKKLEADDTTIPGNLAILLEYNAEGERYGLGAKVKDAVAEYKSLKEEDLADIGLKNNLGFALFYAGQFAEAKAYAEKLNPAPNSLIVAAEAGANGAAAGIAEAKKRVNKEDEAKSLLVSAGDMLMKMRRYKDAADMLEAGANGSNASNTIALAGLLRKAKKHEDLKFEDSPAGFMKEYFVKLCTNQMTLEWMKETASRNARRTIERTDADELAEAAKAGKAIRQGLARNGIPADVMLDILVQSAEVRSEGDDATGYRVTWPLGAGLKMFIVREEGKYKLLDSPTNPNSIGVEVLEREKAGDLKGARTLLDWIRDEQHVAGGDDSLAGKAFPRMWSKGKEGGSEEIRRAAAAILCQTKPTAPEGIAILDPELPKATTEAEKANISLALLEGYSATQDMKKVYDLSSVLAKSYPDSKRLFLDREFALRGLKQYTEADALGNEYLKKNPGDLDGMRALVRSAEARLDYGLARERLREVLQSGKAEAGDYNMSAWYALFAGKIESADVEAAVKGTQMSQHTAYTLHTLGCLYAEQGKTKEAREVLVQAMDQLNMAEPNDAYWYGFGRIAEELGERRIAEEDYKKLKKPKEESSLPSSTYTLAQRRLRQMQDAQSAAKTVGNGD